MEPNASHDRDLIAELRPHIDAAIKASPITCAKLHFCVILEMVLEYGLDPETRIKNFIKMRDKRDRVYRNAMSKLKQNPATKDLVANTLSVIYNPATPLHRAHALMNDLCAKCKITEIVRDCEEVAVAYNVALRYAWANATVLTRFITDEGELKHMLHTNILESINNTFVSTSVTMSPGHDYLPIMYKITVTPGYRNNAFVLTYTSIFECEHPEVLCGYKNYSTLEDEVRIRNCTQIEPGTIEIVFYNDSLPEPTKQALREAYAPLASVTFERRQTS